MIACGWLVDRLGQRDLVNRLRVPAAFAVVACVLLVLAFALPPGAVQYALILAGVFVAGGHAGVTGSVISDVTHPGLRATALATVVLGNNLLGFAPGPVVVGQLSDVLGLKAALTVAPLACLVAAVFFLLAARHYRADSGHFEEPPENAAAHP